MFAAQRGTEHAKTASQSFLNSKYPLSFPDTGSSRAGLGLGLFLSLDYLRKSRLFMSGLLQTKGHKMVWGICYSYDFIKIFKMS